MVRRDGLLIQRWYGDRSRKRREGDRAGLRVGEGRRKLR